jgi:hypothetical protein
MKKKAVLFIAACLSIFTVSICRAQEQATHMPPKVLQIGRETVKPGKGGAHEKMETAWARAFAEAKWPTHWLAVDSISGEHEVWFLIGNDSLAAAEKDMKALEETPALRAADEKYASQESEFLSNARGITATYRDDLSYHVADIQLGKMRYFYVTTIRVRPGHDRQFIEAYKAIVAAHEKVNVPESWAAYEVTLGMPRGTYLLFEPFKSLAEVDAIPETHKAFREALGDEGWKKIDEMASAGIISTENNIFAFSPGMSYVSKETVAEDPKFWTPKPAAKPAPPVKKDTTKGAEQPAAK